MGSKMYTPISYIDSGTLSRIMYVLLIIEHVGDMLRWCNAVDKCVG